MNNAIKQFIRGKQYTKKYLNNDRHYWGSKRQYYTKFALLLREIDKLGFAVWHVHGGTMRVRTKPNSEVIGDNVLVALGGLEVMLGITFYEVHINAQGVSLLFSLCD